MYSTLSDKSTIPKDDATQFGTLIHMSTAGNYHLTPALEKAIADADEDAKKARAAIAAKAANKRRRTIPPNPAP